MTLLIRIYCIYQGGLLGSIISEEDEPEPEPEPGQPEPEPEMSVE